MKTALTIAASDSSSGAGIQADLAVFRDLGVYGVCAVTNITAQNSQGVHKVNRVTPMMISAQIDAVTRDFEIGACKIGMLYYPQAVDLVAERVRRREIPNIVLDPVMKAKHGAELLRPSAIKRMKRRLIPLLTLITPNADEAEVLTGISVTTTEQAREAAKALVGLGAKYALVKGGHTEGEPIDVLFDGTDFHEFTSKRLNKNMHGTGCVLSAAIAARLTLDDDIITAISFAKTYISKAIAHSIKLGKGDLDYYFQTR